MIHQYKLNGYNIVLDVNSGSVHLVDELAYDIIEMYENSDKAEIISAMLDKYGDNPEITEQEICDCIEDVDELKQNGRLFTEDKYENLAFDFKKRNTVIKALCLHIAHTCNLNCEYCFASQGKYHGERALMSLEVGKRAIDFLIEIGNNRLSRFRDGFRIGDVANISLRGTSVGDNFRDGRVEFLFVRTDARNRSARFSQRFGDTETDTAGRAGYDGVFTSQIDLKHLVLPV